MMGVNRLCDFMEYQLNFLYTVVCDGHGQGEADIV